MTKKQYLLKLLTALDGKWPMARGLRLLVEQNILNDQTIDSLYLVFAEAIKNINDKNTKESLIKWQEFLKKLQKVEQEQQMQDSDLDKMLENI